MDTSFGSLKSSFSQDSLKGPGSKRFLIIIIFIVILAGSSFGGYRLLSTKEDVKDKLPPSPIPTEFFIPTETPTPTPNGPTPTISKAVKAAPTKAPNKTLGAKTTFDKKNLSIEILNGSGQVGAASKVADLLKGEGYTIVSTGNASTFDYQDTVIGIKTEKKEYLDGLKKDLSSAYTLSSQEASPSAAADAVVIVGKE